MYGSIQLNIYTNLQFDQPTLLLDGRDVYLDEGSDVFPAYRKYATDLAVAVGADQKAASEQMKDVVDFEIDLAKVIATCTWFAINTFL